MFIARSARVGAPEVVKRLDFGISTALEEFGTSATATSVVGSPLWMAPEQVRRERIRPATDVWALGLLLFYVLTAKPYWRKTFPADAVLFEKMVEPLAAASGRAVELGCGGGIPPGLDPWFARCVARNGGCLVLPRPVQSSRNCKCLIGERVAIGVVDDRGPRRMKHSPKNGE